MKHSDKILLQRNLGKEFKCTYTEFSRKVIKFVPKSITDNGTKSVLYVNVHDVENGKIKYNTVDILNRKTGEFEPISMHRINYVALLNCKHIIDLELL